MLSFKQKLQLPIALDMAKDSKGKDRDRQRELQKRLTADTYMICAVQECYASCKNILNFLVQGEREKAYVNHHLNNFIECVSCRNLDPFLGHIFLSDDFTLKDSTNNKAFLIGVKWVKRHSIA